MESVNWYFRVNDYCKTLASLYGISVIKVAGIMSALSPNNTFKSNIKSLEAFLKTGGNCKVSTYGMQKEKALTIYNSHANIGIEEVKDILGDGKKSGFKTRAFFDNIVRPSESQEVTIDLWMIRWAGLEGSLTPKRYREISQKVVELANSLNLLPHQVQAKLWVDVRGNAW